MVGKSLSYYYTYDEGIGFLKISVGRINPTNEWEFYTETSDLPPDVSESMAEKLAGQFFSIFVSTKAQLFQSGKITANSDEYGHPTLDA